MRQSSLLVAIMVILAACQNAKDSGTAYFKVAGATEADTFVIALTDPTLIAEARAEAAGQEPVKHVTGLVVAEAASYNAPWSFHLDPASISFAEMSIEVCDAATSYVEEHLAEVGGAFLPGRRWCPWSSRVIEEIDAK
jgi:hypothetical protein